MVIVCYSPASQSPHGDVRRGNGKAVNQQELIVNKLIWICLSDRRIPVRALGSGPKNTIIKAKKNFKYAFLILLKF